MVVAMNSIVTMRRRTRLLLTAVMARPALMGVLPADRPPGHCRGGHRPFSRARGEPPATICGDQPRIGPALRSNSKPGWIDAERASMDGARGLSGHGAVAKRRTAVTSRRRGADLAQVGGGRGVKPRGRDRAREVARVALVSLRVVARQGLLPAVDGPDERAAVASSSPARATTKLQ